MDIQSNPSLSLPPFIFQKSVKSQKLGGLARPGTLHPATKKMILEVNVEKLPTHLTPFRSPIIMGLPECCCFPKIEMSGKGEIRL
jgi:hypothetical protein